MKHLPDEELLRKLAFENLPEHYTLKRVELCFGPGSNEPMPQFFSILIEYINNLDEDLKGTLEEIRAFQTWSGILVKNIRENYSPEALAIRFLEKSPSQ